MGTSDPLFHGTFTEVTCQFYDEMAKKLVYLHRDLISYPVAKVGKTKD